MAILGALTRFLSPGEQAKKDGEAEPSAFGSLLSKKPLRQALQLGRQSELPATARLEAGESDGSQTGSATLDGKALAWREFIWRREIQLDHCHWHAVRWRFYENGLVSFDALMSNSGSGVHFGDLQGHRIELRENNGFLLGVWNVGFYVHKGLPPLGFQADIADDHAPLKLQFADIGEKQSGFWFWK